MAKKTHRQLSFGLRIVTLLISLAIALMAGRWYAMRQFADLEVLPEVAEQPLRAEFEEKKKVLELDFAKAEIQKRVELQGISDIYIPRKENLEEFQKNWGTRTYPIPKGIPFFFSVFNYGMQISEPAVIALRLSADERQAAEEAAWNAWVAVVHEEAKHASVKISEPERVVIEIGEFPEEGQKIKDKLKAELIEILGEDRARFIFTYTNPAFAWDRFLKFGQKGYTYEAFKSEKHKSWQARVRGAWYSQIPSDFGRFYDHLPKGARKYIDADDIGLPRFRGEGGRK